MRYIIDAWAWVEYLIGSNYGEKIRNIIENDENEIFTSSVTIAEVLSVVKRENRNFEEAYKIILSNSKAFDVTSEIVKETALIHAEAKKKIKDFGLADSFILSSSKRLNAKIITGDPHFKGFSNVLLIK